MSIIPPPRIRLRSLYDLIIQDLKLLNKNIAKAEINTTQAEIKERFEEICLKAGYLISETKENIQKAHDELQEEQDNFSIALYGNTTAGKSTLLETLRIFLGGEIQTNLPSSLARTPRIDGETIGDGNLDYTRIIEACHFTYNNQTFEILDVPGIEGNQEAKVIKEIEKATKKAHAIFCICFDFISPESGTLEKIKNHLGAQTEVYAIVNKPINSPEGVENLTEDEKEALKDIDQKMKDALGDHYVGHHVLSAKIAFLSVAKNPTPSLKKEQEKFLEKFSKEELLEKSQLKDFANFLTTDFIIDTKKKNEISSFNKARKEIEKCQNTLKGISNHFGEIHEDLKKQFSEIEDIVKKALAVSEAKIKRDTNKIIEDTFNVAREELHDSIDFDLFSSSSKLERWFEKTARKKLENLDDKIKQVLKEPISELQLDIEKAMKNSTEKINPNIDTLSEASLASLLWWNSTLDIKSSFNWMGFLGGSAASAVTLAFVSGPIGWIAAGIGGITSAILNTSDSNPNKKEAISRKLSTMQSQYTSYLDAGIKDFFQKLEEEINMHLSKIQGYSEYFNILKGYTNATIEDIKKMENKYLTLKETK